MAAQDPDILANGAVDTNGVELEFANVKSVVTISVRGFSVSSAVCYIALNSIPVASVGDGRIGLLQNGSIQLRGAIESVGAIMTTGTGIVEVVGNIN